uniref:Uncharacterized protein n=1 Tax=Musa acuminata subsp. malaccensis TaxID=214687 RepID=A0A804HZN6_MUSAM
MIRACFSRRGSLQEL